MDKIQTPAWLPQLIATGTDIALHVLGALLLWVVGRWIIGLVVRLSQSAMSRQKVDPTLIRYLVSTIVGVLNIILVISILGTFGVQTTTFAALFAAIGIAIGTAWSGLLSNLAAGVFMIILRPFKVGDFITAGGITGTVVEIGPFGTSINTPDNIFTIVGNSKILGDNIQNFTHNPYRRVELTMQLNAVVNAPAIMATLKERMAAIPNVLETPAPDVEVLEFTIAGPKLAVRPYTHNENYWQVYFDTNALIQRVGAENGINLAMTHVTMHENPAKSAL